MRKLSASGFPFLRAASVRPAAAAPSSTSLQIARSGDYANVPHDAAFNLTTALTVEAWIFAFADAVTSPMIVCKGVVNSAYQLYLASDDKIYLGIKPSGAQYFAGDPNVVPRDQWVHYAGTYDGTTARLYKNGTEVGTGTGGACSTNSGALRFGEGDSVGTNRFNGLIDEVRLWNVARTQPQISSNRNVNIDPATAGLVGYWKLNDGKGLTAIDSTAARNATLQNSDQWSLSAPF
jgi:hypothetical protein